MIGDFSKGEQVSREQPTMAYDDARLSIDENWIVKAELDDAGCDLSLLVQGVRFGAPVKLFRSPEFDLLNLPGLKGLIMKRLQSPVNC